MRRFKIVINVIIIEHSKQLVVRKPKLCFYRFPLPILLFMSPCFPYCISLFFLFNYFVYIDTIFYEFSEGAQY